MEIRKINIYIAEMTLKEEFRTSFGSVKTRHVPIVRVEERGGEVGWGEVVAGEGPWYSYETHETAVLMLEKYIIPLLFAHNELKAKEVWHTLGSIRGHNMAKAGIEMALWDLEAKLEGRPLYEYLGGVRDEIEAGVSIGIKSRIEELLGEISRRLEEGYKRIKVKIKPGWDLEVLRKIREELGEIKLQADANGAYTLRYMNTLLQLDNYDLLMIEQPLPFTDLADHAVISRKIRTPICLDESITYVDDVKAAYALGSCEIVNVKPGRVGGHLQSSRMIRLCGELGLGCWIGGMLETGVGRGHLVALATLDGVTYPNDISGSDRYWERDIVNPPWNTTRRGTIKAPKNPGIGVEVEEEILEKISVKTMEFVK